MEFIEVSTRGVTKGTGRGRTCMQQRIKDMKRTKSWGSVFSEEVRNVREGAFKLYRKTQTIMENCNMCCVCVGREGALAPYCHSNNGDRLNR